MTAARAAFAVGVLALMGAAIFVIVERTGEAKQNAARRALDARASGLISRSLEPNSPLACLDGAAGEAIETACEKVVFARPDAAAAAVAATAAKLDLLADGTEFARKVDANYERKLAGLRRAIELDRFGIAAHVLATRDGCTSEQCSAFAWLRDSGVIKSNLRSDVFRQYVGRHAASWEQPSQPAPLAVAPLPSGDAALKPPGPNVDFPSASSIPPVSIMNAEPKPVEGDQPNAPAPAKRQGQTSGQQPR